MKKEIEKMLKKGERLAKDIGPIAKDAFSDIKDSTKDLYKKGRKSTHDFIDKTESKKDEVVDLVRKKEKDIRKDTLDVMQPKKEKESKNTNKILGALALLTAAAAGGYVLYNKRKEKREEDIKNASLQIKNWSTLDEESLKKEDEKEMPSFKIDPDEMYFEGSNVYMGDGVILNIRKETDKLEFDDSYIDEPLEMYSFMEQLKDKGDELREKGKMTLDKMKLKAELGKMEAEDKYDEFSEKAKKSGEKIKSEIEEETDEFFESVDDFKDKAKDKKEEIEDDVKEGKEEVDSKLKSNNMDIDPSDPIVPEPGPEKPMENYEDFSDKKDEDSFKDKKEEIEDDFESSKEDLKSNVKNTLDSAKDFIVDKTENISETIKSKLPKDEDIYGEKELIEYNVTIHNSGEEDYKFYPVQIQLYDIKKGSSSLRPLHEEGTMLMRRTIKPGETYEAKLFVNKTIGKLEGLIVYKDLDLEESVLYILEDGKGIEEPELILDEDYLYGDETVLEEEDYKRL